jgi:hypothetical protein
MDRVKPKPVSPGPISEDFGELDWFLGLLSYALLDDTRVVYSSFRNGRAQIYLVDLERCIFRPLEAPYACIQFIRHVSKGKVAFLGRKSDEGSVVVELNLVALDDKPQFKVLKDQNHLKLLAIRVRQT